MCIRDRFDGDLNKISFQIFLNQFMNVVGNNPKLNDSVKLMYLLSFLRDYPLSIVSHLSIIPEHYKVALELLKAEYLDVTTITNDLFASLIAINICLLYTSD